MAYTSERNVVILGKVGSGKRTLGNHIVGGETDLFHHECNDVGTRNVSTHYGERVRGDTIYRILTVDTESLQVGYNDPTTEIKSRFRQIHLIIFVIAHGRYTDESHGSLKHAVENLNQQAKKFSALVITHCEAMTNVQRDSIIAEFKKGSRTSEIAAFMGKETHAVGFPDPSTMDPAVKPILQQNVHVEEEAIRELVNTCDSTIGVEALPGPDIEKTFERPAVLIGQDKSKDSRPKTNPINERLVIMLGKVGSGRKTLGNHIAGRMIFKSNESSSGALIEGNFTEGNTLYRILIINTEVLRNDRNEALQFITNYSQSINLILFVVTHENLYDAESNHMHTVRNLHHSATQISALVITHTELQNRQEVVSRFRAKDDCAHVAGFMDKGIHTVGSLNTSPFPILSEARPDLAAIRKLMRKCELTITIDQQLHQLQCRPQ